MDFQEKSTYQLPNPNKAKVSEVVTAKQVEGSQKHNCHRRVYLLLLDQKFRQIGLIKKERK